jgi:hypothetical protein
MAARQLPAASRDSCRLKSTCINFSASKKVEAETSGPTGGEVANAEGAPAGVLDGLPLCAGATSYELRVAPTTPSDARVRKCLREFFNGSPYSLIILCDLNCKGSNPPPACIDNPLGVGGEALHEWAFATQTFQKMIGNAGGATGVDDDFAPHGISNVGAWIMGRNMFGSGAASRQSSNTLPRVLPIRCTWHTRRRPSQD